MRKNTNEVATGICGGLALLGLGMLAAYAEGERLNQNQKGYFKCVAPSTDIIRRSTVIASGIDVTSDSVTRPYINEYPHRRYSETELRVGDIVFCTLTKSVYMIMQ